MRLARKLRVGALLGALALAITSLAVTLGVGEVGLRLAGYEAIHEVYSKPSIFWRYDELLGWSHTPNATGTYVGPRPWPVEFETPIQINSIGLRGPELSDLPPIGYRILVLGDSVVASFEVQQPETFTALLEKRLNERFGFPVQVINAGVRGYGTDQSYLYFLERGNKLEPDLVVLVHSNNDARNNMTLHRMRRLFGKGVFTLREDGSIERVGHPIPEYPLCSAYGLNASFEPTRRDRGTTRALCGLQMLITDHSALFTFVTMRIRRHPSMVRSLYELGTPPKNARIERDAGYELTSALIRHLHDATRRGGAGFVLVSEEGEQELLDLDSFEAEGMEFHQFFEGIQEGMDPMAVRFNADSHFNARGHELFARFLDPIVATQIRLARPDAAANTLGAGASPP